MREGDPRAHLSLPDKGVPLHVRRRRLSDAAARALRVATACTWPSCDKRRAQGEYGEVPLCIEHVYETWRIARDLAERSENRHKTIHVQDPATGEVKDIERPTAIAGWIYYLRVDGHIKVGYASNLLNRLRQYPPTAEFLHAHRGTKVDEKVTHSLLYLWVAAGREWYEDRPEVLDYVSKMVAKHGPAVDPRIKVKATDPLKVGANYKRPPIRFVRG